MILLKYDIIIAMYTLLNNASQMHMSRLEDCNGIMQIYVKKYEKTKNCEKTR